MTNPTEAPMVNAIDDVKLLPCPFCGDEVELQGSKTLGDRLFVIGCKGESPCLGSGLGIYVTQANLPEAISAWNRRASPSPSQHTGWSDEAVNVAIAAYAASMTPSIDFSRVTPEAHARWATAMRAALTAASSIAPATGFEVKHADDCTWNKTRITLARRCSCGVLDADPISPSVSKESGEPS